MNLYHFSVFIRDAEFTDDLEDRLFAAGCDDALICTHNRAVYLEFDREAPNARAAIDSAFADIRSAGFSDLILQESGVSTLSEMASRAGLSRAALSNYASGKRAANFPKPLFGVASGSPLYSWREVADWLFLNAQLPKNQWEIAQLS